MFDSGQTRVPHKTTFAIHFHYTLSKFITVTSGVVVVVVVPRRGGITRKELLRTNYRDCEQDGGGDKGRARDKTTTRSTFIAVVHIVIASPAVFKATTYCNQIASRLL